MRVDQYLAVVETALSQRQGKDYVYIVESEGSGRVKIGWSSDTTSRIALLRTMSPLPIRLRRLIWGGQPLEFSLHVAFKEFRKHGEWFELSPEIENFIQSTRGLEAWQQAMSMAPRKLVKHLKAVDESPDIFGVMQAVEEHLGQEVRPDAALSWIKCALAAYPTGGMTIVMPHDLLDGWKPVLEDEAPDEYSDLIENHVQVTVHE